MLLKKTVVKNRRRFKAFLVLIVIVLIVISMLTLSSSTTPTAPFTRSGRNGAEEQRSMTGAQRGLGGRIGKVEQQVQLVLKSPRENGIVVVEKYNAQKVRERIMHEKAESLSQAKSGTGEKGDEEQLAPGATLRDSITTAVHIFYSAPVNWYKTKRNSASLAHIATVRDALSDPDRATVLAPTPKPMRILNTAFYPARGLYKPSAKLLQQHFEALRNCGVGVLILGLTGKAGEFELYSQILDLLPSYNLSATFEISVAGNQSVEFLRQQLHEVRRYVAAEGFYHVHAQSRDTSMPVIYVSNAYKLGGSDAPSVGGAGSSTRFTSERPFCTSNPNNLRRVLDAYYIGHIRLKNHAETMRRLCFEGFYSKLPSNGATFASSWKNWSYLKSFALTYKLLFVPTVGPGFAERNKFPRHGDIQRHRSNGRYYGVAWRTAILNHVGFVNIASYNNWPDGSQIEEVAPRAGFLNYSPGSKFKYLDLTTHWVGNFLKTRRETAAMTINGHLNCYELLNNTIC